MKDFFKFTLATVTGLIVTGAVIFIVGIITVFSIISSSDTETMVKKNSVFLLNFNGTLSERSQDNFETFMNEIFEPSITTYSLEDVLASIKKAKEHDDIKAIYINANSLPAPWASLQAIRNALADFKESGKPVIAYSDMYTQGLYYISSVADKVLLNPQGVVEWKGLASSPLFYKGLLEKLGIEMQIFKVGTYKSAVEPFTSTEMSAANREQINAFLNSTWNQVVTDVSASRNLSAAKLNEIADEMLMFYPADDNVKSGLVDSLVYQNDVRDYIKTIIGIDKDSRMPILGINDMKGIKRNVPKDKSGNIIAVYYAVGDITDQEVSNYGNTAIVGTKVIRDLRKLKEDDNVKAVVLRVNSPGGSAFASEQIWHAVKELKSEKPVIVSMGDYAASGGYYISCVADTIVAEPTTLTGSIGIFGIFPNIEGLTNKIGITTDEVTTNKYAAFGNAMRPLNADEKDLMQLMINRGYATFINRCAEGREMSTAAIEKVAEGRVWTGVMAKELGLVDVLGGLDTALDIAIKKADIEKFTVCSYPDNEDFITTLLNKTSKNYIKTKFMQNQFGDLYNNISLINNLENSAKIQARTPFELNIK